MFSVSFKNNDLDRNLGRFFSTDFFNILSSEFTSYIVFIVMFI